MGTNKDWTELLQQKMSEHTAPAPEGLWESIESSLPHQKAPVRKLPLHWAAVLMPLAAAACLTVFVVDGLLHRESVTPSGEDAIIAQVAQDAGFDISLDKDAKALAEDVLAEARKSQAQLKATAGKSIAMEEEKPEVRKVTVCPEKTESPEPAEPVIEENATERQKPERTGLTKEKIAQIVEEYPWNEDFKEDKKQRVRLADNLSVSLHGASSHTGAKDAGVYEAADPGMGTDFMFSGEPVTRSAQKIGTARSPKTSEYKWHISSEVDLLAQKYLGRRFNVGGGIGWTMLEGKSPVSDKRVRADYLGVPVLLGYDFIQQERFHLGADAGVKAMIAVNGPSVVKVENFLFSATAGLNASTPLTNYLSLRLGAGMEYFFPGEGKAALFDSGKPVANISAGVVWTIR